MAARLRLVKHYHVVFQQLLIVTPPPAAPAACWPFRGQECRFFLKGSNFAF